MFRSRDSSLTLALLVTLTIAAAACGRRSLVQQANVQVGNNLIFVQTQVNSSPPLTFILDTGASGMVIDERRLAELGLTATGGGKAETGGGSVAAAEAGTATVQIGRAILPGVTLIAIDLLPLEMATGRRIDGVLGYELFARYVVEIDYLARLVRLHEPASYAPPSGMVAVPIALDEQLPFANVALTATAGTTVTARVEIDTGLTGAITLTRPFVDAVQLLSPTQPRLRISTGALLPGQVSAEVTRLRNVQLGRFDVSDVVASVTSTAGEAGVSGETVGLLGGDLFRRFAVVFDYSRSRLLLRPNAAILEPDEFDMAGISVSAAAPGIFRVRQVIPGSPGAEAGVQAGDLIVSINGRDAARMALDDIRALFQGAGRNYTLGLRRGDLDFDARFTTRRLI